MSLLRAILSAVVSSVSILMVSPSCASPPDEGDNYRETRASGLSVGTIVDDLYWSDGDSGVANGVKFRMSNLDAPETGGVCARIGGSHCEEERRLGYLAKEYVVQLTRAGRVSVTGVHGYDGYGRQIIDLSVEGRDLRTLGLEAGHYRSWVFKNGRASHRKPTYCKVDLCG